jgi:hypothetical protein
MDLSKLNPILGYQMYTEADKIAMARRSAYGVEITITGKVKKSKRKEH